MHLFTGTEGQVGGALLSLLQKFGTVTAPKLAEFDFTKPDTLTAVLDQEKPDLIINPAAFSNIVSAAPPKGEHIFRDSTRQTK
jgi:dTDP-4-dehydrorhamnose reductase